MARAGPAGGELEGSPEEALTWAAYARALAERLAVPPSLRAQLLCAQAEALWQAGREEQSLVEQEQALELLEKHDGHPLDRAAILAAMGNSYAMLGRLDDADSVLNDARRLAVSVYGEHHPGTGRIDNSLGVVAYRRGDLARAAEHFETARATLSRALGEHHPDLMFSLGNLGNVHREQGNLQEALAAMQRVWSIVQANYPEVHRESGTTLHNLAEILAQMGRCSAALEHYRRALEIRREVHGEAHPFVANTLTGLASCLLATRNTSEALEHVRTAWAMREDRSMDEVDTARTAFVLARVERHEDPNSKASREATKRLERVLATLGPDNARAESLRAEVDAWRSEPGP